MEQNERAHPQLTGPAAEFAGHLEALGGRPKGGDFFQFGFQCHAAGLFGLGFWRDGIF
jgi:hypothetical protein